MNQDAIANLLKDFQKLTIEEREKFIDYISVNSAPSDFKYIVDTKLTKGLVCPHCGATGKGVSKNGVHSNGRPRYICKHCGKRFSATTNGVLYYSKKPLKVWKGFISCFLHGFSVRKSAEICGINKNTAFLWRHKLCDSLVGIMENVNMGGIVEADETYFRVSYKGNRAAFMNGLIDRKRRKRGTSIHHKGRKRGLSREQVCVPCAINRVGLSVSKISGVGAPSYKGVSTKHLNGYLVYNNFVNHARETYTEKVRVLTNHICAAFSFTKRTRISARPLIPFLEMAA